MDEYKSWLQKAEDNLKWAEDNFYDGFYPLVCFLVQQAIELSLKGFLYKKEIIAPKSHKLLDIYKICEKSGRKLSAEQNKQLDVITDYYFESRYPDMENQNLNNKSVAQDGLFAAKKIVDEVKKQIK